MGGCVSTWMILESNHNINLSASSSAANVITINGQLRQFPIPITVSQLVLQLEMESSTSSSIFICNSDALYFDQHIPALNSNDELRAGQIYFILPNSKLNYPLSASDMAALALKASTAISNVSSNKSQQQLMASIQSASEQDMNMNMNITKSKKSSVVALGISRSGSMGGKLQRYSGRRTILVARSFNRLTTIHEGSHLQAY